MLELDDPLWDKLKTMFGKERVPTLLSALAAGDKTADTRLWQELSHLGSCCGATYAAVPHLLKIAEPEESRHKRREIALFLSGVALDSNPGQSPGDESEDEEARTLIVGSGCSIQPMNTGDLEKMRSIMAEFYSAMPAIRALCEQALLENEGADAAQYLLSGIAAADGLIDLASLLALSNPCEGEFTCSSCGWSYWFIRFGERFAVYADEDRFVSDSKVGAPSQADGFMTPVKEDGVLDARVAALLALANRAPEAALLLRHFAGSFVCRKCGVEGPLDPAWWSLHGPRWQVALGAKQD